MTEQVTAQSAAITAKAKAEAEAILTASRQEGTTLRERSLRDIENELAAAAQRSKERAEAEAHMLVLTTKDTLASEILEAAQAELARTAQSDAFPAVLEALLDELLQEANGDVVVLAPPAHVETVKNLLAQKGKEVLAVEPLNGLNDGVAIQDRDQTYRVTNTLSARFTGQEGALRKLCLQKLFGQEK